MKNTPQGVIGRWRRASRSRLESARRARSSRGGDRGAVLVLALLFVVAVGLVTTALATWATNDLNNAKTFTNVEALHSDATGMMKLSISYVRYNPIISGSQTANVASPVVACWGGSNVANLPVIDGDQVAVWCSTVWNPGLATTRVVTFYACAASVPASVCTLSGKTLLTEVVTFDDYPSGTNAPNQTLCSLFCGIGMTVKSSTWGAALVDAQANAPVSAQFVVEPSATIVNAATTAQVEILDSQGLPVSGETVTLSAESPGSLASGSSVSVITNVAGVAVFNNIVPTTAGTVLLQATDGSIVATSTGFMVGQGANAVTVNATTPSNPQVGSVFVLTPSPAATATSGDVVSITGTSGICSASGSSITMVAVGTCVLTFSDAGNANYVAATPVTMSFNVVPVPAASLAISPAQTSESASSTPNDTLTIKLLTSSGAATTSNGTTTVALSQNGSGTFANNTVTFANGASTATASFGDKFVTNAVTVTASSMGLTSASTSIKIVPGAASQIVVGANPSSVIASSTSNVTISYSIEDQYGNVVSPSRPTTVTFSMNPSTANGFFTTAPSSSTTTSSISLPAGTGSGTIYFGDTKSETVAVTVTASSGVAGDTSVTVTPGSPTTVTIATGRAPNTSSGPSDPVTIGLLDAYNNPVVPSAGTPIYLSLASTGSGYFSANGKSTTSTQISAGQSSVTVYFGDTAADNPATITVTQGTISATAAIFVSAATATQITLSPTSSKISAGSTEPMTITLESSTGATVNATASTLINLSCASSTCSFTNSSGATINQVQIPKGASSVRVHYGDTNKSKGNYISLTAASAGLTSGTALVKVV